MKVRVHVDHFPMPIVLVEDVALLDIGRDTICMEQLFRVVAGLTCDTESCAMPPGIVSSSGFDRLCHRCLLGCQWLATGIDSHFEFSEFQRYRPDIIEMQD